MPHLPKYDLSYAPETLDHLDAVERKYHRLIQKTIEEQLSYIPARRTRNRKPLDQPAPFEATWELRFGPDNRFWVFYEIEVETPTVRILAIGIKVGDRLFIGREEYTP